ncbi:MULTISPECIES: glycosyltransferase [unclassified Nitrospina]|uniref:glycosyltransferase n=1 Tax=unclassified Nitrospina TaxID=2638683 RepID=UPI003F9ABD86
MNYQESSGQKSQERFKPGAERVRLDLQNEKVAVLVAGMHRSGTSALTRTLNLLGCDLPKTPSNDPDHWESKVIMDLNDAILESGGSFWHDWERFNPGWRDSPLVDAFRARARDALSSEFGNSPLFVLKDPRICRLLGFWLETLQEMKITPAVVSPIRNPLEVAASLEVRDGIPPSISKLLWLRHVLDAEAASRGYRRIFLRYHDLLDEWQTVTQRLGGQLGISWPKSSTVTEMQIEEYLSPTRRHHWKKDENILKNPGLSNWVRSTYQILIRWARDEVWESDTSDLDEIRAAFDEASHAFSRPVAVGRKALQENRQYEERNEELENKLKARDAEAQEHRARADDFENQLKARNANVKEYEGLTAKLREQLEARRAEAETLSATAQEWKEAAEQYHRRVDELESQLKARGDDVEKLKTTLGERSVRIQEHEHAQSALQARLETRDTEVEALTSRLREREEAVQEQRARAEDLESKLASHEAETEALKSSLENQENRLREYEESIAELSAHLELRRADAEKLAETLRERESKTQEYEETVSDLKDQLEARRAEVDKLTATLREREDAARESEARISGLKDQLKTRDAAIGEYEATTSRLNDELQARRAEIEEMNAAIREREEAVQEQCDRADDMENRLNTRAAEAEELKSSLENEEGKLREYEEAIAELSAHLEWRRADSEKLAEALRERETKIQQYEKTVSGLNDQLETRRTQMEELSATLRKHEAKVREQEAALSQLHVESETRAKKADKLSLQLRDEQDKAKKIFAQLRDEQNKSKRISAGAARRIREISEYFFHFENWLSETLRSKRWKAGNLMGNAFSRYTPSALKPAVMGTAKFVYKWIGPALDAGPEDWEKELLQIRGRVLELMKTDDLKNEDSPAVSEETGGHAFENLTDWRTHAKTSPNSPLHKALVTAETASLSRNWPEAVSQWQAVQAKFPDKPLLANIAKSNASIARRLARIDAYKKEIAEYRTWRGAVRSQLPGKRIAIYTAISGNYDSVKLPETLDPRFDYFLFTDTPASDAGIFQVRPMTYFHEDKTRMARYVKTHPHMLLPEYDIAVWVDSNIMILGDIHPLIETFLASGRPVAAVPHPLRKTIHEELEACVKLNKDAPEVMEEQIAFYQASGFEHDDLIESNFMMFDLKNHRVRSALNFWWKEIDRFSRRDQLSLNYSLSQNRIAWNRITRHPDSIRNHPLFALVEHDASKGPASELIRSLDAPERDPYSGPSYAEVRKDRIAAQAHRRIDIVVCVHNALEEVRHCLESIERARQSEHHKLIVIDDGSAPATADYLKAFIRGKPWARLHRNEKATGYTRAANRGLGLSDAELVILLNSDTVVTSGWAEKMADAVFFTPGAGIVGPLSNAASHQSIPEHRSSKDQTAVNELPPGLTAEDMNRYCEQWTTVGILPRVPLVHGFCFGVTRAVIEKVGTFDETHFPKGYGEENDYCFRAVDAGFGLVVATHTFVFHAKSKSYDGPERVALMKAGSKAFRQIHGNARIDRAVKSMQTNRILEKLRQHAWKLMG